MPRNPNLKSNVKYDCAVCSKHVERYMTPYDQKQYPPLYCSRKCAGIAHRGESHPMWSGGRRVNDQGYVLVYKPDHPHADAKGHMREHRLVMEQHLGRLLLPVEVVHHINGDTSDNRIANLQLFANNAEHKRHDIAFRDRDADGRLTPLVSERN